MHNYIFPEISFDDVDKYDFPKKAFIEFIKSPDYVHLYFDIDSLLYYDEKQIKTENKKKGFVEVIVSEYYMFKRFEDIIQWLDSLKHVFGDYSVGGYTNNKAVSDKYHIRLYLECNHYISMHVVYYQTMLKEV